MSRSTISYAITLSLGVVVCNSVYYDVGDGVSGVVVDVFSAGV